MKRYLFTSFAAVLLFGACSKQKNYTASFNTAISNYYLNQTVTFNNTSGGGGSSWDFGDGNKSTEQSPKHAYSQAGNFTVTLTDGNSVATKVITVYNGTSAFKVHNNITENVPMYTYAMDASGNKIDSISLNILPPDGVSPIYYTLDTAIYIGGQSYVNGGKTFVVAPPDYPYVLTRNEINTFQFTAQTPVYVLNSVPGKNNKIRDIISAGQKTTLAELLKK